MTYKNQIRLNTKVLDSQGRTLPILVTSKHHTINSNDIYIYKIEYHGEEIGYTKFIVEPNSLFIQSMYNYTIGGFSKIQHVGSALFECVFKASLELGKEGNIWLESIDESSAAYYKMGLRKQSDAYTFFMKEIEEYKDEPNNFNKNQLIKKFEKFEHSYNKLKQESSYNLKKDIIDITFDDVINHGRNSQYNEMFKQKLKINKNLSSEDCEMMQSFMYLTEDSIDYLIEKFDINSFSPIGSNYDGSFLFKASRYSFNDFPQKLKELVEAKIVDPANAIEILCKHPTDEQLDYILSPIGCEMMSRDYISGWIMLVYLTNELKQFTSEKFLHYLEDGTINHIEDYILCPYKYEKLFDELENTKIVGDNYLTDV